MKYIKSLFCSLQTTAQSLLLTKKNKTMKTICKNEKKHIAGCAKCKIFTFTDIKHHFYMSYDMRMKINREKLGKLAQSYKDMGGFDGMKEIFNKRISRKKK